MRFSFQGVQFLPTVVKIVSYLLVFVPAVCGFLYVYTFGVNVVEGDSWSMVGYFDKLSSGTLSLSDLLELHSDHWIFFPRIVMLLLGTITEWNIKAEMYLIQVCLLGTLVCLMLALRDSSRSKSAFLPLFMIPLSVLVCFQEPLVLRGFLITQVFAVTFSVLALYLLDTLKHESHRKAAFVASLTSATVASFSSAPGIFVWPAGLLQLCISPIERRTKRIFIFLWGSVGLGVWIAYLIARVSKRKKQEYGFSALADPVTAIDYFLKFLGNPLFYTNYAFAVGLLLAGLVLMCLFLVYKDRRQLSKYSFWISLLFWSFLVMGSIVAGRFLAEKGAVFREVYTIFSLLAIASIYGLLATTTVGRKLGINTILLVLLAGAVLLEAGISYSGNIKVGSIEKASGEEAASVLSTYESQSDEALREHWKKAPERVRKDAAILKRLEYNVFSDSSKP